MLIFKASPKFSDLSPGNEDLWQWIFPRLTALGIGAAVAAGTYIVVVQAEMGNFAFLGAINPGAVALGVLLTGLLMYPLCDFLVYGWVRRKEEIEACLSSEAKSIYFKIWLEDNVNALGAKDAFRKYYAERFGRRRYVLPILFVFLVALVETCVLSRAGIDIVKDGLAAKQPDKFALSTSAAAIAGAYTFVAWDFFARVQRRALSTVDVLRGGLRLAMSVPLAFAFVSLDTDHAPFIAYGVGVFPLDAIKTILWRQVSKYLKTEADAAPSADPVAKLSGINSDIADRIGDADIATIPQLAWCDPIQLVMRTSLSFDFVLDIVSQALAFSYLDGKLEKVRPLGLRGAYEMRTLWLELESGTDQKKAQAEEVLKAAATAADIPLAGMRNAITQISKDEVTVFLSEAARSGA